jgi:hypothetical protein
VDVFFSLIGKTLPDDVRIDSVAPSVDKEGIVVHMIVVSRRTDDLALFIERLQDTGAFYDVLPQQEDSTEDGNRRTTVAARYLSPRLKQPSPRPRNPKPQSQGR